MDSNFNNPEVPADLPEDQEPKMNVKVVAARSKAKAKPQRREPVDVPSIIPMSERKLIDIDPRESQNEDISIALKYQEQLFISELFKDIQDVISLILHYRTM